MVELICQWLLNRGYKDIDIVLVFNEAAAKVEGKYCQLFIPTTTPPYTYISNEKIVCFHYEYHKRGISRKVVRDTYDLAYNTPDEDGNSLKSYSTPHGEKS